jgi:RNA polymerase sigma factor (sigma-70 family)
MHRATPTSNLTDVGNGYSAPYDENDLVKFRDRAKLVAQRFGLVEAEAEDVAQNTLLALIQNEQVQSPTAWVITVALRGAMGVIRRRARHTQLAQLALLDCSHAANACEMSDLLPDLARTLERLGQLEREIFLSRELNLYTFDDLSVRTGLSISTLKRRLFRARRLIRDRV